jgi:hypothetical protein
MQSQNIRSDTSHSVWVHCSSSDKGPPRLNQPASAGSNLLSAGAQRAASARCACWDTLPSWTLMVPAAPAVSSDTPPLMSAGMLRCSHVWITKQWRFSHTPTTMATASSWSQLRSPVAWVVTATMATPYRMRSPSQASSQVRSQPVADVCPLLMQMLQE